MQSAIEAAMERGAKNRAKKALAAAKPGPLQSATKTTAKVVHKAKVKRSGR